MAKVLVIGGAGAMGGFYAATLAGAGHEVAILDGWRDGVEAIAARGLTLESFDGERRTVTVAAGERPAGRQRYDAALVLVKGHQTAAAAEVLGAAISDDTLVVTLQNGWGNLQTLRDRLGDRRVVVGISVHSAGLAAPGEVRQTGKGSTVIGEPDGPVTARIEALKAILAASGPVTVSTDILAEVWTKLALNCACLPACGLLRITSGRLLELPSAVRLMQAVVAEVVTVAAAEGVRLDQSRVWDRVVDVVSKAQAVRASMLQDMEAGRRTEIGTINAAVVATAERHGIDAPVNRTLARLIEAYDETLAASPGRPA